MFVISVFNPPNRKLTHEEKEITSYLVKQEAIFLKYISKINQFLMNDYYLYKYLTLK